MVETISVAPIVLQKGLVIQNKAAVVGKYSNYNTMIPKGSMFYQNTVVEESKLPDSAFISVEKGQIPYNFPVNLDTTYGNSIYPGNSIDLYYRTAKVVNRQQIVWFGKFIESIKVLSVTDAQGNNVFETNGDPGVPAYLLFSVPNKVFRLLKIAERSNGQIIPVQRNANYSKNPKQTAIVNSSIEEHIRSFAVSDELFQLDRAETGRCSE